MDLILKFKFSATNQSKTGLDKINQYVPRYID